MAYLLFYKNNNLKMSFRALKQVQYNDLKTAIIGNSQTITVGDAIVPGATGHAKAAITGASVSTRVLGVVVAIVGKGGTVLELNSVTTGSGNESTPVHYVQYIPSSLDMEYEADMSAAIGTTTDSDGNGVSFNIGSTAALLDETSVALGSATTKQFVSYGQSDVIGAPTTRIVGHWSKPLSL